MNIADSKSYATKKNLEAALAKAGLASKHPIIVRNDEGRWTAIFGLHLSGMAETGDVMFAARHGFLTIN